MEAISTLPRRLTKLYSDTKTSCDAVVEQDASEAQPEVNELHRQYCIQKNRLVAWGAEWSQTKGKHMDIDESMERANLTEMVGSVLGTIKDILDEAARMHPPDAPAAPAARQPLAAEKAQPAASDPPSWAASKRARYEHLARDLETSINLLYDISRGQHLQHQDTPRGPSPKTDTVSRPPRPPNPSQVFLSADYNASDVTLINPASLPLNASVPHTPSQPNLPPKLDPSQLLLPQEEPPPYESVGKSSIKVIGRLLSKNSSTNPWKTDGGKTVETPVLVEYATYDATYRATGVSPPTDRLETLLSILARFENDQSPHGTLQCVGYFEDPKQPRFGLVFELPKSVYPGVNEPQKTLEELRPVTLLSVLQTGSKSLHNSNSATPPLEDRFRLAFTLGLTFSKFHAHRFVHKDVNSSNIVLFRKNNRQSANSRALNYALRSPVICSFDLFSDYEIESTDTMPTLNIYRHPEDPKFTGEKDKEYGSQFDLYSLALILLEIGLWQPLGDLWKPKYTLADFQKRVEDVYIRRLASKCGTAYMQAVRDCFSAADCIASGAENEQTISQLYSRILIRLQRCCLLDETDTGFEWSTGAAPMAGSTPPKRKNDNQGMEIPSSPSYKSAKRWAMEKGSHALERTKSLSKKSPQSSPNPSTLSRNPSSRSQHSLRKSISHSLNLLGPKEEPQLMDWQRDRDQDPLGESGTLVDTPLDSQSRSESSSIYKSEASNAASVIQRAWRGSRKESNDETPKSMTLKDYRDKVMIIQKTWRQRKQKRSNTIGALVTDGIRHWPQATLGYPTPEPESQHGDVEVVQNSNQSSDCVTSSIQIQTDVEAPPRPKLRLHPIQFSPAIVDEWHTAMLPRLERLIERALKDSDETISIDLVAIGCTQEIARPTILVTCSSVAKIKALLNRRFKYDENIYDLKVRRGKIRRSKLNRSSKRSQGPHRSMMNTASYGGDMHAMNPYHQQRPVCGASIGAFRGQHLPAVTYGGVVLVDDEPLGMSVHHLLDAPSDEECEPDDEAVGPSPDDIVLSSATSTHNPWLVGMGAQPGVQDAPESPSPMWDLEITDDENDTKSDLEDAESYEFSDSEYESDEESNDDVMEYSVSSRATTGDIGGVDICDGEEIKITQPAIDDISDDFFPNEEDRDDDHLSSHELGHVHASSGIRRWKRDGVVHEIDWALLKLNDDRLQPYNLVQGGRRFCVNRTVEPDQRQIAARLEQPITRHYYKKEEDEFPNSVANADNLGGLNVHCFGRTTGLQGGMVGPAMSSVRIYQRKSFSRSWYVAGGFGMGGDSGAWVIQNGTHRVVGHVLAWCQRNHIAYICPMQVLLEDIKRTLGARRIYLPGSVEEAKHLNRIYANGSTAHTAPIKDKEDNHTRVQQLEVGVESLGIVDSAVAMGRMAGTAPRTGTTTATGGTGRRSRNTRSEARDVDIRNAGDSDKENLPRIKSRFLQLEGRPAGCQLEVVGAP